MLRRTSPALTLSFCAAALLAPALDARAGEPVDLDMVTRIRDEGLRRSEIMDTVRYLTDEIGPRITGSPALKRAHAWTLARLEAWGLENGRQEPYEFGRGWSFDRCSVHLVSPRKAPLLALPSAWTPGTPGPVRGEAMRIEVEKPEDLERYEGQLAGKIVFIDDLRPYDPESDSNRDPFQRHDEASLADLVEFPIPDDGSSPWRKEYRKRWELRQALGTFLVEEGAVGMVEISSRDNGIVRITGMSSLEPQSPAGVTGLGMAAEHYNWILRMLKARDEDPEKGDGSTGEEDDGLNGPVILEIDVTAAFHEDDLQAWNTIAEIPGSTKADEVVIAGGHLDAWHAGAGATDNATGVAVVMEAMRILKALEVEPKRTIRAALWSGEESGYYGSRAYVSEHFATRPEHSDPEQMKLPVGLRETLWPLTLKPGHATLAAYFNYDNGGGRIRGIYAQENAAVVPIFEAWLKPFADLGATRVTMRNTSGTDHVPFDRVGLPGFQFIQDRLEYGTRTHHTNLDVYDHLVADDLKQSAVVMASFIYHAAMRDEMLPRKPVPEEPPEGNQVTETAPSRSRIPDQPGDADAVQLCQAWSIIRPRGGRIHHAPDAAACPVPHLAGPVGL